MSMRLVESSFLFPTDLGRSKETLIAGYNNVWSLFFTKHKPLILLLVLTLENQALEHKIPGPLVKEP